MTLQSAVGPVYFSDHPFGLILLFLSSVSSSFRPSLQSNFAVIKLSFFFLGLKMPDDFHSTAIVLETFSDICLEDRRSVE